MTYRADMVMSSLFDYKSASIGSYMFSIFILIVKE